MTEQEKIEQAAENFSRNHNFAQDRTLLEDGFEAGASFYAKEVMPEKMVEFAEWATEKYIYEPEFKLYFTIDGKSMVALVDIVNEFFEQSKQKDNEQHKSQSLDAGS